MIQHKTFPTLLSQIFLYVNAILLLSCTRESAPGPLPLPRVDSPVSANVKTYLALGDSYTIGQAVTENERFPVQVSEMLRKDGFDMAKPEIIATTGWTTGNLLDAIKVKTTAKPYDVVTLLIGVNNQYQRRTVAEYREQFTTLLIKAIQLAGDSASKVVVLSIPDYSVTPYAANADRQRIADEIDAFNQVNKEISASYNVHYINVTEESRKAAQDAELVAGDGLHFSGKAYKVWAGLMLPVFKAILR